TLTYTYTPSLTPSATPDATLTNTPWATYTPQPTSAFSPTPSLTPTPMGSMNQPWTRTTNYAYDGRYRLQSVNTVLNGQPGTLSFSYQYDLDGNLTNAIQMPGNQSDIYTYNVDNEQTCHERF